MGFVSPVSRISVAQEGDWTRIDVPSRRQWFYLLFLGFWLIGWAIGFTSAVGNILRGSGGLFLLVWLSMWTVGGVFAAIAFFWMVVGRDTLWISKDRIARRLALGPLTRTQEFDVSAVTLSWWKENAGGHRSFTFFLGNSVAFSYGGRDISVGYGVDETEAQTILDTLTQVAGIPQK